MSSEVEKKEKIQKTLQIKDLEEDLLATRSLLHKDELIWPYQKLDLRNFTKKFFPYQTDQTESFKYSKLKPDKFLLAVENKLKTTASFMKPLDGVSTIQTVRPLAVGKT